jgi:hypothetical protein
MLVSEEDKGEDLVEALNKDGLLSPVIDDWRVQYLDQYKTWFAFCRRLNQGAMKVWIDHWRRGESGSSAALLPTAGRIFGRSMNSFAASVILCERGMAVEAANLARSISEASFWLAYMVEAPERALSDLEADDLKNFIDREQELQRISKDDLNTCELSKARENNYREKLNGRKTRSISAIAREFGVKDGYLKYRLISGFYSHLSQASLRHNFLSTGQKTGVNILGPHASEIPKALNFAADSLIDCGAAYSALVADWSAADAFSKFGAEMGTLHDNE